MCHHFHPIDREQIDEAEATREGERDRAEMEPKGEEPERKPVVPTADD